MSEIMSDHSTLFNDPMLKLNKSIESVRRQPAATIQDSFIKRCEGIRSTREAMVENWKATLDTGKL